MYNFILTLRSKADRSAVENRRSLVNRGHIENESTITTKLISIREERSLQENYLIQILFPRAVKNVPPQYHYANASVCLISIGTWERFQADAYY